MSREPQFPAPFTFVNGKPIHVAAEVEHWRKHRRMLIARATFDATMGDHTDVK